MRLPQSVSLTLESATIRHGVPALDTVGNRLGFVRHSVKVTGHASPIWLDLTPENWPTFYVRIGRTIDRRGQVYAEEDIHDGADHQQAPEG